MLLTNMAIRSETETGQAPDGTAGRTDARFQLTMDWIGSPDELERLKTHFNEGRPTVQFWKALAWGQVPSAGSSTVAVSVGQVGHTAQPVEVLVPVGVDRSVVAMVHVAGLGLDGTAIGTMVPIQIGVRSC